MNILRYYPVNKTHLSTWVEKQLLLFFMVLATTASAQPPQGSPAERIITGRYGFEGETDINGWSAKNGGLSLSAAHYKDGRRSLQWDWSEGATLQVPSLKGLKEAGGVFEGGQPEVYEPSFYPKDRFGGIKIWLYQEKPAGGQLIFQVGKDVAAAQKNPKYRFAVNLDFTGWRTVWVGFEEDASVLGYKGSDELNALIAYPQNVKERTGKLFIDHLTLLTFVSNKRNSDAQFVNHKRAGLRSADAYEILKPWQAFNAGNNTQTIDTGLLAAGSRQIADRLQFLILGDGTDSWKERYRNMGKDMEGRIRAANSFYDKLNIQTKNGFVTGLPLFGIRDEHPAAEGMVFENAMQPVLFPLAMDYKLNGNQASKEKLLRAFDYFLDQGWAAGSSMGTVDHVIKMAPIAVPVFLLRDELKAQNKLRPEADMLAWHTRLGSLLHIDNTHGENSDLIRGGAIAKLVAILLMDDNARKQQMLQDFKRFLDHATAIAPGYSDTFKPDFSIYHHRGTYLNTYGTNALNTLALMHWLLQGTPYALSAQSTANLKQALVRQAQIAYGVEIHYGVGGRFPLGNNSINTFILPAYAYMSMRGNTVADTAMGRLFNYLYGITDPQGIKGMLFPALTYSGTYGTLNLMAGLHRQMKDQAAKPGDGAVAMPFSGLFTYRKGNAFATVKGYNKYVWDYESGGKNENNLGRYLSHGMLITAQGNEKDGFAGLEMNNGFDWSMLPGATTKMLPADKVLYFAKPDEKYIEGKHRNFSESRMASGVHQEGNGLFGFDLRDDVFPDEDRSLFDSSFRARKSYFFIGNEIICLGSGIHNRDGRYHTVTTLFQYHTNPQKPNFVNGKIISSGEQKAGGAWFTDQNGLQYIIPGGQDIVWSQKPQVAYRSANVGDQKKIALAKGEPYQKIEATYTRAWFDHGTAPQNKGYEYEILLNTTAAAAKPYLQNKTYEVLEKNNAAHIIRHRFAGITAYAIFEPNRSLAGILQSTDAPLLAMAKKENDSSLLLTIADPDIQQPRWGHNMSNMPDSINNTWNKGSVVTVTLKGEWYPARHIVPLIDHEIKDGKTIIRLYCRDGESIDVPLQQRVAGSGEVE
ncbi:chondroitinase family polysaccharide lyase [Niabella aurantiaca]|uniref:chondroitinase family polysaccharide lyase n=1 Tax=Niabella aurantiaca TaxID=379900 RepID=UPI0003780A83|nr:chondroitinase family polysaccharide lyase [Niabella aurantiaca]